MALVGTLACAEEGKDQCEEYNQQVELHRLSNPYHIIDCNQRSAPTVYQEIVSQEPNKTVE